MKPQQFSAEAMRKHKEESYHLFRFELRFANRHGMTVAMPLNEKQLKQFMKIFNSWKK